MKIHDLEILIGSDPELFVKKDGEFISGHELIEGTKAHPYKVRGGAVQVDGTALEYNTLPAKNKAAFHRNTRLVLKQLNKMIPPELELVANPTAHFAHEYMNQLPPEVLELGCDPDFNAYTGNENKPPDANVNFRTGAGHIHVGWTDVKNPRSGNHMDECRAIAQAMDIFLGAPSVLIDMDNHRRKLYGKAGAFRPKPYGMEYRVLSNFWVLDPKLRGWVYDNAIFALQRLLDKKNPLKPCDGLARSAINCSHQHTATRVVNRFAVPMPRGYEVKRPANVGRFY